MDHKYIDQFDIVESYLAGKLAAEESTEFEEHFVDCSKCVDRLETTKAFVEGLRVVSSDRASAAVAERYTASRKAFAAAACVLSLVVIAGAVLVFTQMRRYRGEAEEARSASTQWERRYEEERQSSATTAKDHQESVRELAEQIAQLRTELGNERKPGSHDDVQANLQILMLSATRGSEPPSGSAREVTLSRSSTSFAIIVPLEGESGYRHYVMTIVGREKESIWTGRVKVNRDNAVSMGFKSTLFRAGDYFVTLAGVATDGSTSVIGKYSFRVRKTS